MEAWNQQKWIDPVDQSQTAKYGTFDKISLVIFGLCRANWCGFLVCLVQIGADWCRFKLLACAPRQLACHTLQSGSNAVTEQCPYMGMFAKCKASAK